MLQKMVGQTQRPWVRQNPSSSLTQCQTEKKFSQTLETLLIITVIAGVLQWNTANYHCDCRCFTVKHFANYQIAGVLQWNTANYHWLLVFYSKTLLIITVIAGVLQWNTVLIITVIAGVLQWNTVLIITVIAGVLQWNTLLIITVISGVFIEPQKCCNHIMLWVWALGGSMS
jgi:hypothetical protein